MTRARCFPGFEHPGTEFIHLLEGSLTYRHGDETHLLKAGDALTFAGAVPHGPEKLLEDPDPHAVDHHLRRQPDARLTCDFSSLAPD